MNRKVKLNLTIDLEGGEFEISFNNISNPGKDIDMVELARAVNKVMGNITERFNKMESAKSNKGFAN